MTPMVPMNLEAERDLLGVLLCEPFKLPEAEGVVRAIDFCDPRHQLVFAAMGTLLRDGGTPTAAAIFERVKNQSDFTALGGFEYLRILADKAPSALMVEGLAKTVAGVALRRRAWDVGEQIKANASLGALTAEQVIAIGEGALGEALRGGGYGDAWADGDALHLDNEELLAGRAPPMFLSTGIETYDRVIGGLQRNRMNVLGARTKMGKTALATIIGMRIALRGLGVGMVSLEMGKQELAMRLACTLAFRQGANDNPMYFLAAKNMLSDAARARMIHGSQQLRDIPFFCDDRAGLTPSQIVAACKRLMLKWHRAKVDPGLIIVDHLAIVAPEYRTGNKVADVTDISGALRDLFKAEGVTGQVLCQLSRESVKRGVTDLRPQLTDLSWASAIEQDAAQVTLLHRPGFYLREPLKTEDDYQIKQVEYEEKRDRWADRCLLINAANRMGPSEEMEFGLSLGCNALWEIAA